jgi:cell wall assembly regulator SMI1
MSLSRFVTVWTHPDYPPDRVTAEELQGAERRLRTRLPTDYRESVLKFGLPRPNIDLLDTIVDRRLDLRGVSDFFSPVEMVTVTDEWRDLGLSEELVAFATDSTGNLFCFAVGSTANREAPVLFFDHDSRVVEVIAPSFSQWIDEFCALAAH